MAKSKSSEVEFLREVNRKLKAENKNLRKRLGHAYKQVRKNYDHIEDIEPDFAVEPEKEVDRVLCPKCQAELKIIDLEIKKLFICECGYRKTSKK